VQKLGGQVEATQPHTDHHSNDQQVHYAAAEGRAQRSKAIPAVNEEERGQDEYEHREGH